jgi:hypothetical protein
VPDNFNDNLDALYRDNMRLSREIRHLRCVMLEAAQSINPAHDRELFAQLVGAPDHFVTDEHNPYPEHEDQVSDQNLAFLTWLTECLGGYVEEDDKSEGSE